MKKTIRQKKNARHFSVAELFAGVGGFRVGLEDANSELGENVFEVVWSNQWEPVTKRQHASDVYVARWGEAGHSNEDIATVSAKAIPPINVLVGGFPCQDYSVARTLSQATGLIGKKGVLWWQIHRLLHEKKPEFGIFENVDRLLKSPANRRGRDFAVMLASLAEIGYMADWRVINAADYGMPQKRRRVFIFVFREDSHFGKMAKANPNQWMLETGVLAKAFPASTATVPQDSLFQCESLCLIGSLPDITEKFNKANPTKSPFANAGHMQGRAVYTAKVKSAYRGGKVLLRNVLVDESAVPKEYFIDEKDLPQWKYLKGKKNAKRVGKDGFEYSYNEGAIAFPDDIDSPSRTIITGEGGKTPSRFKHIILTKSGKYRRLIPVELEQLNMFPKNHTQVDGITDTKRAFFMGNALVTGVVKRIAISLAKSLKSERRFLARVTDRNLLSERYAV